MRRQIWLKADGYQVRVYNGDGVSGTARRKPLFLSLSLSHKPTTATSLTINSCRLDCIVLGFHRQYHLNEGKECHSPGDWKCLNGQCLHADERSKLSSTRENLYDVTIEIKSAHVQDEDNFPVNGESDVFVVVKVDGETIGNTPTIQDTNKPVWDKFVLKPNPISLDARLKFALYDSDKPAKPDYLGFYENTVKQLVAKSGEKLYLTLDGRENRPYHIIVEVTATQKQ